MRARTTISAVALVVALTAAPSRAGMSPAESARRAAVVATVGSKAVTAGELEDRLAAIPRFQLLSLGGTPDAIRRKFLADVMVPEVLVALAAEKEHLDQDVATQNSIRRAIAGAAIRAAKADAPPMTSISKDDIRKYFEDNRSKFDTPNRFAVWRILCAKRDEALTVIDAVKASPTVDTFTRLAREHSIDKATDLRAGNMGFIDIEGNSNEAGLKVDPAVAKAAAALKDGELYPQPVPEAGAFAVVWRRGSTPAAHRSVEESTPQIRETLYRQRMEERAKDYIDGLRQAHLVESNEGVLNGIEVSSVDGEVTPRRRPGQVPPLHQIGRAPPRP